MRTIRFLIILNTSKINLTVVILCSKHTMVELCESIKISSNSHRIRPFTQLTTHCIDVTFNICYETINFVRERRLQQGLWSTLPISDICENIPSCGIQRIDQRSISSYTSPGFVRLFLIIK